MVSLPRTLVALLWFVAASFATPGEVQNAAATTSSGDSASSRGADPETLVMLWDRARTLEYETEYALELADRDMRRRLVGAALLRFESLAGNLRALSAIYNAVYHQDPSIGAKGDALEAMGQAQQRLKATLSTVAQLRQLARIP